MATTFTNATLPDVVELMRQLSLQTDPQKAASLYGEGLVRFRIVKADRYLSLSRRNLPSPQLRITRDSNWTQQPNPWKEPQRLPLITGGLLAEILYSNQPAVITDLPARLAPGDPARDFLKDYNLLVSLPHFDQGESINAGLLLNHSADGFPFEQLPMMVWMANLWGRATLNLVNQQRLQVAHDEMDRELKVVADIQRSLLPRELPNLKNVEIAVHYQSSRRAGGDYYDFFPLPNNQTGIFLADVSGHGTPAAVLMAITHAIAHSHPSDPMPPEKLLAFLNEKLSQHYTDNNGNFVTAFYAIFKPYPDNLGNTPGQPRATLTYASAGHPPPILVRKDSVEDLEGETFYPLGVTFAEAFHSRTIQLFPGDRLLFYTDGIPDTFNPAGDPYTLFRLQEAALTHRGESPKDHLTHILDEIHTFAEGSPITDDQTLLILEIR